jgi:hypothetical protein
MRKTRTVGEGAHLGLVERESARQILARRLRQDRGDAFVVGQRDLRFVDHELTQARAAHGADALALRIEGDLERDLERVARKPLGPNGGRLAPALRRARHRACVELDAHNHSASVTALASATRRRPLRGTPRRLPLSRRQRVDPGIRREQRANTASSASALDLRIAVALEQRRDWSRAGHETRRAGGSPGVGARAVGIEPSGAARVDTSDSVRGARPFAQPHERDRARSRAAVSAEYDRVTGALGGGTRVRG